MESSASPPRQFRSMPRPRPPMPSSRPPPMPSSRPPPLPQTLASQTLKPTPSASSVPGQPRGNFDKTPNAEDLNSSAHYYRRQSPSSSSSSHSRQRRTPLTQVLPRLYISDWRASAARLKERNISRVLRVAVEGERDDDFVGNDGNLQISTLEVFDPITPHCLTKMADLVAALRLKKDSSLAIVQKDELGLASLAVLAYLVKYERHSLERATERLEQRLDGTEISVDRKRALVQFGDGLRAAEPLTSTAAAADVRPLEQKRPSSMAAARTLCLNWFPVSVVAIVALFFARWLLDDYFPGNKTSCVDF